MTDTWRPSCRAAAATWSNSASLLTRTQTFVNVPSNHSRSTAEMGVASWALIECESQQVRWRDDGTAPTSTVGILMNVGDILTYDGTKLAALKFIEQCCGK